MTESLEVENNLAALRQKRGFSVAGLAKSVNVSRQTIYAMEAGEYVPNTAVALRLAHTLDVTVEDLFALPGKAPAFPSAQVTILPGAGTLQPGQPVQLCHVNKRLIASAPSSVTWCLPASDAVVTGKLGHNRSAKVELYNADVDLEHRLLAAGCDPGISVLARHVQAAGVELVLAHRNSTEALALLKRGSIHIAGTHLRDETSGESNIREVARIFPTNTVAVISFAAWEEGIVTAPGNPKQIGGIEDLSRADIRIVNRENGAGSRILLDSRLERLQIHPSEVAGYQDLAWGHLPGAWQVQTGAVDCCIATRAAARVFGLGFIPLVSERYDLVVRRTHLKLPSVQLVLDALNRRKFRRELESVGGYDAKTAGRRIL